MEQLFLNTYVISNNELFIITCEYIYSHVILIEINKLRKKFYARKLF